jgi:oligosaccharide repeat unit polymerase
MKKRPGAQIAIGAGEFTDAAMSGRSDKDARAGFARVRPAMGPVPPAAFASVALLVFTFALVVAVGIALFVAGLYSAPTMVIVEAIEVALIVIISMVSGRLLGRRFDLFEPSIVVNLLFLLHFCVRPIYLMSSTNFSDPDYFVSHNPAEVIDYVWAVGYAMVGLFFFHLGYYAKEYRPREVAQRRVNQWSSARVTRVVIIGGLWATASAAVCVFAAGGIAETMANVGRLRSMTGGYGYGIVGTSFFAIAAVLLLVDHLLGHPRTISIICFSAASVGFRALFGDRTGMLAIIVACVLVYSYIRGIRSYVRFAFWSIGIGIVVIPTLSLWATIRSMNMSMVDVVPVVEMVYTQDSRIVYAGILDEFGNADAFAAILHGGPSVFPFQYGKTYSDAVLMAVPRSVWPDKPKSFGTAVGDYVADIPTDVPPGEIGELYVNFHVFGIATGMFMLGLLMNYVYQRSTSSGFGALAIYALSVPYFAGILTRNSLDGVVLLLCSILPMWPAIWYIEGHQLELAERPSPVTS